MCCASLISCNSGTTAVSNGNISKGKCSVPASSLGYSFLTAKNNTQSTIVRYEVYDKNNILLANKTLENNCISEDYCNISLPDKLKDDIIIKFYTSSELASSLYYQINSSIQSIDINDYNTGYYVLRELAKQHQVAPIIMQNKLIEYFGLSSQDSELNQYMVDLGLYYIEQIKKGSTEPQIQNKILSDLNSNLHVESSFKDKLRYQSIRAQTLTTDSKQCLSQSTITTISSSVPASIPYASAAAKAFGFLLSKTANICPTGEEKILAKLDQINKAITEINNQLSTLDIKIDSISELLNNQNLKNSTDKFMCTGDDGYNSWMKHYSEYSGYIFQTRSTDSKISSFSDIVKKIGGVEKIYSNPTKYTIAYDIFTSTSDIASDIKVMNDTKLLTEIKNNLINVCNSNIKISGDIITTRDNCNLVATDIINKLIVVNVTSREMLHDIYNASATSSKDATFATNNVKLPVNIIDSLTWSNIHQKLDAYFSQQDLYLKSYISYSNQEKVKPLLLGPIAGFPTDLYNNLVRAECSYDEKIPAITKWINVGGDKNKNTNHLGAYCRSSGWVSDVEPRRGYSTYNYQKDGTDMINMLGVMVSSTNKHGLYVPDDRDLSDLMQIEDQQWYNGDGFYHYTVEIEDGNPDLLQINGGPEYIPDTYHYQAVSLFAYGGNDYDLWKRGSQLISNIAVKRVDPYESDGSNQTHTIARSKLLYNDPDGVPSLFYISNLISAYRGDKLRNQGVTLECRTYDCSVVKRTGSYQEIKFTSGLKVKLDRCRGSNSHDLCIHFNH